MVDGVDNNCDDIDEGTVNFDDGDCFCEDLPCYGLIMSICSPYLMGIVTISPMVIQEHQRLVTQLMRIVMGLLIIIH